MHPVEKNWEGTPIKLKVEKGLKHRHRKQCTARTKAGRPCQAPSIERDLCFCHAHPERLSELGRQGGKKNRRWKVDGGNLPHKSLKSIADVSDLLEETINRVRQGPFDLRAANGIGFLASTLLKAIESGRIEHRLAHLEAVVSRSTGTETQAFKFRPRDDEESQEIFRHGQEAFTRSTSAVGGVAGTGLSGRIK
jgi:hypothetical protein